MIFSIYIINKAGGLVYNKDYSDGLAKLSANEYLVLAGTFHGYGKKPPRTSITLKENIRNTGFPDRYFSLPLYF